MVGIVATLLLGSGLGLLPNEMPPGVGASSHPRTAADGGSSRGTAPSSPALPLATLALAGAILAQSNRRGRPHTDPAPGSALSLRPPDEVRVVFVPGYANPHASIVFRELVALTGLDPSSVRYFDYRWISGIDDHRTASRLVPAQAAALSLNSFLAGVAAEGYPVYVVGFSKGGATLAHLIAEWDRGFPGPSDAVAGAILLDPPIASGVVGQMQTLGRIWSAIPDDGGYDPFRCTVLRISCVDTRIGLGRASGVEVLVIQNPKAAITNAAVPPPGLRVVAAPDDGPTIRQQVVRNPIRVPGRIFEAHRSVLHDPKVAECIVAEMRAAGSCALAPVPSPIGGSGLPIGWFVP